MTAHVSDDAPTQAIPRIPATGLDVTDDRVTAQARDAEVSAGPETKTAAPAPAESAAPEAEAEVAGEESLEHIYATSLAELHALYDRWPVAIAEIREASASGDPGEALDRRRSGDGGPRQAAPRHSSRRSSGNVPPHTPARSFAATA